MRKIPINFRFLKIALFSMLLFSCEGEKFEPHPLTVSPLDITSISSQYMVEQAVFNDYTTSTNISDYFRSFLVHFDYGVVICKINGLEIWRNVTEWNRERIVLERTGNRNSMSMEVMSKRGERDFPELLIRITKDDPGFNFLPQEFNKGFYDITLVPLGSLLPERP